MASYLETARLLTQVAPLVFVEDTFALKGGTAINLFVREMPRLSVDLDLVFVDYSIPRDAALGRISEAIRQAAERIRRHGLETRIQTTSDVGETKLLVRRGSTVVKIEVNFVMRGTVYPVRRASLTHTAREALQSDLEIPVVSLEDLYGGKLVAAMDRQHPRDLFDVMHLFTHEGITPAIRRAFVVYLSCHNRPVHEVLFPALRELDHEYENNFLGMTAEAIPISALQATRHRMIAELQQGMDEEERNFLRSLVVGEPDWRIMGIPHLEHLPAVRWKLLNLLQLKKKNRKRFAEQAEMLENRFRSL